MKDEYCKEYWAGRLIDLDKDIAWDIAEEIIESQSTLRKDLVEKWISVEDRLPEVEKRVLIITESKKMYVSFRDKFINKIKWLPIHDDNVTHWQPLPKPPND